jgi:anti-anti-sigma regulatory factor
VLILDMLDVGAIDREGLDALASVAGTARQQQAQLRVAGRSEHLRQIGALSELDGSVSHFDSVEDALREVRQALEEKHASGVSARCGLAVWDERLRRLFRRH